MGIELELAVLLAFSVLGQTVDLRTFWRHGGGHILAVRQYNWLTSDAPSAAQATVSLRGYKFGRRTGRFEN